MYGHTGHARHTSPTLQQLPRVLCALPVPSLSPWLPQIMLLTSFLISADTVILHAVLNAVHLLLGVCCSFMWHSVMNSCLDGHSEEAV